MDPFEEHRHALEAYRRAADEARDAKRRRAADAYKPRASDDERPVFPMGDREFAWAAIHAFLEAATETETRPAVKDALRVLAGPYERLRDLRDRGGDNGGGGGGEERST